MLATDPSNPLVRRLVATVMLLAAWGAAVARADDRYLSEEGRFRIAFPAAPREETLDKAGHHRRAHAEGDRLFLETRFIGFDRSRGRIDTALELQVLDEQGRPMLEKPGTAALATADPAVVRDNEVVTFVVEVPCPRVTKATVRALATDKAGGARATLELPLEIHEQLPQP